jgi:hypothetical protein
MEPEVHLQEPITGLYNQPIFEMCLIISSGFQESSGGS